MFASLAKGAGLQWRPLHFSAEAPTDTTGETVGATCCTRRDWKNGKAGIYVNNKATKK